MFKCNSSRSMLLCTSAAAAFGLSPMAVHAQQADTAPQVNDASDSAFDGAITVTARRREETLLEVPVAINAFSAEALAARNIRSLNDVADFTPAVTLTNQGGSRVDRTNQTFIIRGMNPQSSATASVFIDGAPVVGGFVEGLDDVERVEILKGPQSATFGRQAFAGAVNLVTRTPADTLKGRMSAIVGSDSLVDVRAMLEGPLIPDLLSFRISPRYYSVHGQYKNAADSGVRFGDQSTKSFTGNLILTPTPDLSIKYFGQLFFDRDGLAPVAHFTKQDFNCNAGAAPAGTNNFLCGTLPEFPTSRLGQNVIMDQAFVDIILRNSQGLVNPLFKNALGLREGGMKRNAQHHHVSIDWDIPSLGVAIKSLTATNITKSSVINDLDLTDTRNVPNPNFGVRPNAPAFMNSQFNFQTYNIDRSQELRVESTGNNRFDFSFGASYVYSRGQTSSSAITPTGPSLQINGNPTITKTLGFFGSLSYKITDQLTVSAEGRYQIDKVTLYNRGANDGPFTYVVGSKFKNFVPRFIARYEFTDDWNIYASYSKGVNPGAFNSTFINLTPEQQQLLSEQYGSGIVVDPEMLDNYEVGIKGRFWNGRGQISLSGYRAIWTDQIVSQALEVRQPTGAIVIINAITNIGKTTLTGFEVEGSLRPFDHLTVDFSGAVADSKIDSFFCATCGLQTGDPLVEGMMLPRYSKYTAALGATYTVPVGADAEFFARADYVFKSGVYDSPANIAKTQDMNKVNLRAGIRKDPWSIEAFVENLFNDRAYLSIENNVDLINTGNRVLNLLMPTLRRGGVRAKFDF